MYGGEEKCVQFGVGIPEGNRPLGKPRRISENNIKMNLQEVECTAWTGLIWVR